MQVPEAKPEKPVRIPGGKGAKGRGGRRQGRGRQNVHHVEEVVEDAKYVNSLMEMLDETDVSGSESRLASLAIELKSQGVCGEVEPSARVELWCAGC